MFKSVNNILFAVTGSMAKPVKTLLRILLTIMLAVLISINVYAQSNSWDELNDQIDILYEEGSYSEVIVIAEKALKVANETYGADHYNTAKSMDNFSKLYKTMGKYTKSETLGKLSLAIRANIFGEEHASV